MTSLDPRLTPARPDLAAEDLRGIVDAARFAAGMAMRVVHPAAPLRREPRSDAPLDTEALMGAAVTVYEQTEEGWSWGQLEADSYVGWLPSEALRPEGSAPPPTHVVTPLRTFLYPGPSIKLPPAAAVPQGAALAVASVQGDFAALDGGGFAYLSHLSPLGPFAEDPVAVAEAYRGIPYLWGGRTSFGIDCSGLVQASLAATGRMAPRDSDMQEAALGEALQGAAQELRRGDLVFWKGHVGIMRDPVTLLHASGHHMLVVSEPLEQARARILAASGLDVRTTRRP